MSRASGLGVGGSCREATASDRLGLNAHTVIDRVLTGTLTGTLIGTLIGTLDTYGSHSDCTTYVFVCGLIVCWSVACVLIAIVCWHRGMVSCVRTDGNSDSHVCSLLFICNLTDCALIDSCEAGLAPSQRRGRKHPGDA